MSSQTKISISSEVKKEIDKKHLLVDSDVIIGTFNFGAVGEFLKNFKSAKVELCTTAMIKMEVLNTKKKHDIKDLTNFLSSSNFWDLPFTAKDIEYWHTTQNLSRGLSKLPGIIDFHIAAKSLINTDMYILTGNLRDYSADLFEFVGAVEFSNSSMRTVWSVLKPLKDREFMKEVHA